MRFSTSPSSPTRTASALPWPRLTNSTWRRVLLCFSASTTPAQRESPDSISPASDRNSSTPRCLPLSSLTEATNYINARIGGLTLAEARTRIEAEIEARRAQLDELTARVVTDGLATWSGEADDRQSLIVCGRAHLLEDVHAMEDLERVRLLFEDLDAKKDLIQLLGLAERAEGVRIFIGSENKLFSLSGSALIVSPFEDSEQKIVGMLGVIGPTRLNYGRIIPMVDYTARLLGRLVP